MTTLSFRLGPIRVHVHFLFLLMGLAFGLSAQRGPRGVAFWAGNFVATVFAHELAHAVASHLVGAPAEVKLTLLRIGAAAQTRALSCGRRIVVSLAGPAASLGLGAAVLTTAGMHAPGGDLLPTGLRLAGWMNVGWGLVNLLPVLPLDAGHALVAVLDRTTEGRGEAPVRWVSVVAAGGLGLIALHFHAFLPAFIAVTIIFQNVQALGARPRNGDAILRVRVQAARDALERGDATVAIGHCRAILEGQADPVIRTDAVRLLAYAYATSGGWGQLIDLIESGGLLDLGDGDLEKYERAARELGRARDAGRIALLRAQRGA